MISKKPRILLDGSHNKEAIDALIKSLENYTYDRLIVGFSILKDKDYPYIIEKLSKVAGKIILTQIEDNPRAFDLDDLYEIVMEKFDDVEKIKDPIEAYNFSKKIASDKDLVIWCGSLYLVGNLLKYEKES